MGVVTVTFAQRLASDEGRNLRFYATVQGVRHALQSASADVPAVLLSATRTRLRCITSVQQAGRELDLVSRRAKGGALTLRLLDDDAHSLRALFTMRKRRAGYISADHSAAAVTISVSSTAAFAASGDLWVGAECIAYTGKTGTTFTGCTRGSYNSTARALRGGASNGQAIYTSPPSWVGRSVSLVGYFLDASGAGPALAAMQTTLGVYEIETAPQYLGDDEWQIDAIDRIDGYLSKGIYVGVEEVTTLPAFVLASLSPYVEDRQRMLLNVGDRLRLVGTTANVTPGPAAHIKLGGMGHERNLSRIVTVEDTDIAGDVGPWWTGAIEVDTESAINLYAAHIQADQREHRDGFRVSSAVACAYLRDSADVVALQVLTSRVGDGANGAYDVLRGRDGASVVGDPDPDVLDWRIGAAIKAADIDTAAFADVGGGVEMFYLADEPSTVADFLREFCLLTDSFVMSDAQGRLTVKRMGDVASVSTTIGNGDLVGSAPIRAEYNEDAVYPHVMLECSYDSLGQTYNDRVEVRDFELAERYPTRDETLTIKSKSVFVAGTWSFYSWVAVPARPLAQVQALLRRWQSDDGGRGALVIDARVHLDHALTPIGSFASLTASDVPDMEGGTISARRCRVIGVEVDWDAGFVDLRLQVSRDSKRIAPGATISAVAGNALSLETVAAGTSAVPEGLFGVGNTVLVWDVSGSVSFQTTLSAVTLSAVTLTALPAFVIQAGVDFLTHGPSTVNDTAPTLVDSYSPVSDYIYQVDDDEAAYLAAVPAAGESRWR